MALAAVLAAAGAVWLRPRTCLKLLGVVVATRLPPGSCPFCRPINARSVGQVTAVCGVVRHAGRSRSIPVGYPDRRMIEHDCNPAVRQAGYPVGEEHDPDHSALEHGAGWNLSCQPYGPLPYQGVSAHSVTCHVTGRPRMCSLAIDRETPPMAARLGTRRARLAVSRSLVLHAWHNS